MNNKKINKFVTKNLTNVTKFDIKVGV